MNVLLSITGIHMPGISKRALQQGMSPRTLALKTPGCSGYKVEDKEGWVHIIDGEKIILSPVMVSKEKSALEKLLRKPTQKEQKFIVEAINSGQPVLKVGDKITNKKGKVLLEVTCQ